MHISISRGWGQRVSVIALAAILPLTGCIAHAPGSGGQQQISVTITGSVSTPAKIPVSTATTASTITFTASVAGTSNQAVTWALSPYTGSGCSGTSLGQIASTGTSAALYTAPQQIPAVPCQIVVTATSSEDTTVTAQALVEADVIVQVSPATDVAGIGQGANLQYSATVTGAPSNQQGVTWSASGGGAFDGSNSGLFVAPQLAQGQGPASVTITATSVFDPNQNGTATTTIQKTDPLGTVSNVQAFTPCPADSNGGLNNGTCYSMTVSCDQVADITAGVKVNVPASPVATVLFLIGSGGNGLYDNNPGWAFGYQTVENVYNANRTTVQVSFGAPFKNNQQNGWLQGPGGVRRLACRFATVADWIYNNPTMIGLSSSATTAAPYCATGNSGGSGALAYAVYNYGLAGFGGKTAEFTMVEPTSGPVMSRLDQGCVCNNNAMGKKGPCTTDTGPTPMCYSPSEAEIIDSAYQAAGQTTPTLCSDGLTGTVTTNANRFLSDSILYQPSVTILSPKSTTINVRFGGLDTTTAVPQGESWIVAFGTQPTQTCTEDAPHEIPSVQDGATDIANDIISSCK